LSNYTEYLKCEFTDAEISDRARELAASNRSRTAIEQQNTQAAKRRGERRHKRNPEPEAFADGSAPDPA
jgi:hypothetical protein